MKAEAVIASAFVIIVFRLVRDVVANHKTTRFTGGSDYLCKFYCICNYTILAFLSYSSPPASGSIPYSIVHKCLYFKA